MKMDMLKPAREIITELNQTDSKWTSILIHGVGRIQNVIYNKDEWCDNIYYWSFKIALNDGIQIKCGMRCRKENEDYFYFQEGDRIEFFGKIYTHWQGRFCRYNVSQIDLYDAKLSCEERAFSDVFMWDIKVYNIGGRAVAHTINERIGCIDSQIACVNELEETPERKWTYGHLIKKGEDVIVQLDKVI